MKFANYKFNARGVNNLGDNMQIIALDYIYDQMGIPKEDIVYIDKNELNNYRGEYVILPVSMPLVDYVESGISGRFSEHIIPVFLGLTMVVDTLSEKEVNYYRRFEPIGCRDERTLNTLRNHGIDSYLHGCITATLPKRQVSKQYNKVFIVDVSEDLIKHIPDKLRKDAVFLTHMHEETNDPKQLMQQYYERYKNEAKLVITSLLHCSVPCMAAGIPVVLAKTQVSYRFAWLEKLIRIYDAGEFNSIDWDPLPIEYESHKKRLLEITIGRLEDAYNKYKNILDLSWYYENRNKKEYIIDAFESIKNYIDRKFIDKNSNFQYSIWGLTQISILTVEYISKNYPNAKLMHVYDAYRRVIFEGIMSESPKEIYNNPDEIIFVTTHSAEEMAMNIFGEIKKDEDSYVFFEPMK